MKALVFLAGPLALVWASGLSAAGAGFEVQADKENVVASRLEGPWRPHAALTQRLMGGGPSAQGDSPTGLVAFKSDPSVAGKIPAKYEKPLSGKRVYMAGLMTLRGKDHPFLLIELRGNPHVVFFREREGDPMGDAESFNVMLAVGKDSPNDLLFIGGDFNNQPFSAFERSQER